MSTYNVNTTWRTLFKRIVLCGLAALALSAASLRPAAALPPGGGGDPDPNPPTKPAPLHQPDLYISDLLKFDAHHVMVYVRNQGNTSSAPCDLRLVVYTYDVISGTLSAYTIADYAVPAIQPGGFSTIMTSTSPSIYFSNFEFVFTVDAFNVVAERIESNNQSWFFNP